LKRADLLIRAFLRRMATDKFIMVFMFLIVCGILTIIIYKVTPAPCLALWPASGARARLRTRASAGAWRCAPCRRPRSCSSAVCVPLD
jgi:hypothetical protein